VSETINKFSGVCSCIVQSCQIIMAVQVIYKYDSSKFTSTLKIIMNHNSGS